MNNFHVTWTRPYIPQRPFPCYKFLTTSFSWRGGQPSCVTEQVPSDVTRLPVRLSSWRVLPRLSVSHYVDGETVIPLLSDFKNGRFCVWALFALIQSLLCSVPITKLIVVEIAKVNYLP
jgi:hypothetical protein